VDILKPKGHGFFANPLTKTGYNLAFSDSFDTATLDTKKWMPYYLPQWSSRELAAARYNLTGASLRLLIEEDQQPWCPEYDGAVRVSSFQTGCFSGAIGTAVGQHRFTPGLSVSEPQPKVKLYTPQYGYFEARLKAVPISGYMVALWMIGFEEHPEQSGEICICEIFGSEVSKGESIIGYGIHPFNDASLTDDFHKDRLKLDASSYHIYAAEWTPTQVEFFVDNTSLRILPQSPQYPMQFMLGIYEIPDQLKSNSLNSSWPKIMEVDYVRGYQPIAGYESWQRFD
jgi:hypothetical protein